MTGSPDMPAELRAAFDAMPSALVPRLTDLRALIFDVAERDTRIGPLDETLKWGEPAYRPSRPRTGSTIRLGPSRATPGTCALFFICTTRLIDTFRDRFANLRYEGDRAILVAPQGPIPPELPFCIGAALSYHLTGPRA